MLKIKTKVIIKTKDELLNEGLIVSQGDGLFMNENDRFMFFADYPYFGQTTTIKYVDEHDKNVPYYLSCNCWAPEWLIKLDEPEVKVEKVVDNKPKVYINKFNNKPFGALFIKLINIDEKIATFSSTAFSRLKKHELQYIARLLMNQGCEAININATVPELSTYCYTNTKTLNV